jgi:hypothetical protein
MRIACLGRAARIAVITLAAASATLWACAAVTADQITAECFVLLCHAATTTSLGLLAVIIGLVIRDGIRDALIDRIRPTQPGDGERLHLVRDEDAG